jgi:hypothetical protein
MVYQYCPDIWKAAAMVYQYCPDIWKAAANVYQYCPDIFQEKLRKATKTSTMIMSSIVIIVFWAVSTSG